MSGRKTACRQHETSHKVTRAAALLELNGEAVVIKLSVEAWRAVLAIAARDAGGTLSGAKMPNQGIFEVIGVPECMTLTEAR
ncbi:MAG: hypothetical protein ABF443_15165 [Acetobacter malorum]|uniref:hypothetical protein n=1 Tax=Acetobacter malorum TaxID=178901 RepID=UPI0039EB1D60